MRKIILGAVVTAALFGSVACGGDDGGSTAAGPASMSSSSDPSSAGSSDRVAQDRSDERPTTGEDPDSVFCRAVADYERISVEALDSVDPRQGGKPDVQAIMGAMADMAQAAPDEVKADAALLTDRIEAVLGRLMSGEDDPTAQIVALLTAFQEDPDFLAALERFGRVAEQQCGATFDEAIDALPSTGPADPAR